MTMPLDLEHHLITKMNRDGFLNVFRQPEFMGFDVFGDPINPGDDVVFDGDDVILQDNLEKYLAKYYDFKFQTME